MEMTITDQRMASLERLVDDAWTADCAIRLHQPAWAAAIVEAVAAELARHEEESLEAWRSVAGTTGQTVATEIRTVRRELHTLSHELHQGTCRSRADVYEWITTLIHHEAIAVADAAWRLVD
jgi:hypothetical protein